MRLLPLLLLLSGCASLDPHPYLEVGVGYMIDERSDWFLQSYRSWTCDKETFHVELGAEFARQWKLGWHHQSHISCGTWNDRPELYQEEIILTKKFGGRK